MHYAKLSERPEHFELTPDEHPLKRGLVFAGLGRTRGTTRYHDSSLRGNHGTLTNMDPATDWVWDSTLNRFALDFDGSDDYVLNSNFVVTQDPVTIATWGYPTTNNAVQYPVCIATASTGAGYYGLRYDGTAGGDPITCRKFCIGAPAQTATGPGNTVNTWQHWAATFESTTRRVAWRNGIPGTANTGTSSDFPSDRMTVGAYCSTTFSSYFAGRLADTFVWLRTLSQSELQQLADPSNVMLSGLILPPRRRLWAVTGGAVTPSWIWARQQQAQVIGGGAL